MSRNGKKESAELDTSALPSLPKGWCWTTVGEIGEVRLGRQRSPKNRSDKYPTKYVRAANITWQGLSLDDVMDMDFKPSERATYALQTGDILLSEASGSADEVGKPAIWNGEISECCFQNTVIRFRPHDLPPDYPFIVFCHFARNKAFAHVAKGIGIHHLGADRFGQMPFPLPPVAEQVRIKAKVDELFSDLDAGVAALERARANLKRYRAAVLKTAVEGRLTADWRAKNPPKETGPQLLARILRERRRKWEEEQLAAFAKAEKTPPAKWKDKYKEPAGPDCVSLPALPEGWCVASLEQLTSATRVICYGILMPKEDVPDGVLYVKVKDMKGDKINLLTLERTSPEIAGQYARASLIEGDLLLAIRGTYGRVAIVPPELNGGNITQDTARLAVIPQANSAYVAWYLRASNCQNYFKRVARGVAVKGVNIGDVRPCPILLPPLAEQQQIVEEIEDRLSVVGKAEEQVQFDLKRSSCLRHTILRRAFEGRLVSQDPTDEPAVALLERIQTANAAANGKPKSRKTK